jgi:hypothetical protein
MPLVNYLLQTYKKDLIIIGPGAPAGQIFAGDQP